MLSDEEWDDLFERIERLVLDSDAPIKSRRESFLAKAIEHGYEPAVSEFLKWFNYEVTDK